MLFATEGTISFHSGDSEVLNVLYSESSILQCVDWFTYFHFCDIVKYLMMYYVF